MPGEQCHHADHAIVDNQRMAVKAHHAFARRPAGVVDLLIVNDVVGDHGRPPCAIRPIFNCPSGTRPCRPLRCVYWPALACSSKRHTLVIERPDARESGAQVLHQCLGAPLQHGLWRSSSGQGHADVASEQRPLRQQGPHPFSLLAIMDVADTAGDDVPSVHDVGLYRQLDGQLLAVLCEPDEFPDTAFQRRAGITAVSGRPISSETA